MSTPVIRWYGRAAVAAVAVKQIFETAPVHELRAALESYLADEFYNVQRQAFDDAQFAGVHDA
jgi:hypothetical protein